MYDKFMYLLLFYLLLITGFARAPTRKGSAQGKRKEGLKGKRTGGETAREDERRALCTQSLDAPAPPPARTCERASQSVADACTAVEPSPCAPCARASLLAAPRTRGNRQKTRTCMWMGWPGGLYLMALSNTKLMSASTSSPELYFMLCHQSPGGRVRAGEGGGVDSVC